MESLAAKSMRWLQLALAVLCFCLSAAIVGTAADALRVYNHERSSMNAWWLPLWPQYFNTSDTPTLIGTGAAILVLNVVYIVFSSIPRITLFHSRNRAALLSVGVALPGFILALCAVVYSHVLNDDTGSAGGRDTIMSWTCKFKLSESAADSAAVPADLSSSSFDRLCHESQFAYYGMITVLVLEALALVATGYRWIATKPVQGSIPKTYEYSPERESPVVVIEEPK